MEKISKKITVEPRYLKILNSIFSKHISNKLIWAFGSRVKGNSTKRSDLDCVVFDATDVEISNAKEAFDESNIPFILQLLIWEKIPDDFKKNIKQRYFILQKTSSSLRRQGSSH